MKFKLIIIALIILALSGCIDKSSPKEKIEFFTPLYGSMSNKLIAVEITFEKDDSFIEQNIIYISRDNVLIEKLYKAFKQHKKVYISYKSVFLEDHLSISSVDILDENNTVTKE